MAQEMKMSGEGVVNKEQKKEGDSIMVQEMEMSGEGVVNKEELLPSWSYATKKTAANGLLNSALLMSNASQIKALFGISEPSRDGFWYTQVILLIMSILIQIVTTVLLVILGYQKPKTLESCNKCKRMNNVATSLAALITIINIIIAAFGVELSSS